MREKPSLWIAFLLLILLCNACGPVASIPSTPATTPSLPKSETVANFPTIKPPTQAFFQGPLTVTITNLGDNDVVSSSPVRIEGEANPGTVISFNDIHVIVDTNRKYGIDIPLDPGINTIEIVASDDQGNQDFKFLTLTLDE